MRSKLSSRATAMFVAASILSSCDGSSSGQSSAAPTDPVEQTSAPLPALFADAETCLLKCKSVDVYTSNHFSDLLRKRSARPEFERLIAQFPAQFAPIAHLKPDDRTDLPLDGYLAASLIMPDGRTIRIYDDVGYPEKQWVNWDTFRRPEGTLWVAVEPSSGRMAGIFNGPSDLSNFWLRGDPSLLSALLAYVAVGDIELDRAIEAAKANAEAPKLKFPLPSEFRSRAADRIEYLAEHFADGNITGTETTSAKKESAQDEAGQSWFAPNGSHTACIRSGGPAEKLEEFEGFMDRPTTQDYTDANGNVTKVEVSNDEQNGTTRVWSFYRGRSDCEAEWVTRTEDLADRYR